MTIVRSVHIDAVKTSTTIHRKINRTQTLHYRVNARLISIFFPAADEHNVYRTNRLYVYSTTAIIVIPTKTPRADSRQLLDYTTV